MSLINLKTNQNKARVCVGFTEPKMFTTWSFTENLSAREDYRLNFGCELLTLIKLSFQCKVLFG